MAFCPACGRSLDPHALSCAGCGRARAASAPAAPPLRPGPPGTSRPPLLTVLFTLMTLGIYLYVFAWRSARDVDAYRREQRARAPVKLAALLLLGGIVLFVAVVAVSYSETSLESLAPTPPPSLAETIGILVAVSLVSLLLFVSYVLLLIGMWHVWSFIRSEEIRAARPVLSPGLMLALAIIPYVNLVGIWVVLYVTQQRINRVWQTPSGPAPAPLSV